MTALRQVFYHLPPFPARHVAIAQNGAGPELDGERLSSFKIVREGHPPLIAAAEAGQKPAVLFVAPTRRRVEALRRAFSTRPSSWLYQFASVEDPAMPGRRAQWITDAENLFTQTGYEQYQGVLYFDLVKQCDWRVETTPDALATFAAMGADEL